MPLKRIEPYPGSGLLPAAVCERCCDTRVAESLEDLERFLQQQGWLLGGPYPPVTNPPALDDPATKFVCPACASEPRGTCWYQHLFRFENGGWQRMGASRAAPERAAVRSVEELEREYAACLAARPEGCAVCFWASWDGEKWMSRWESGEWRPTFRAFTSEPPDEEIAPDVIV